MICFANTKDIIKKDCYALQMQRNMYIYSNKIRQNVTSGNDKWRDSEYAGKPAQGFSS